MSPEALIWLATSERDKGGGVPKNFFDIICLGADLPGLVASALLAKQGYRTLVVRPPPSSDPHAQGPGPPLLFVGDHSSPVLRWGFAHLGLTQDVRNRLNPQSPAYQVALPCHRLDLGGKSPETAYELQREFPGQAAAAQDALKQVVRAHEELQPLFDSPPIIPPGGFWERRRLRKRLRAVGLDDDLAVPDPLSALSDESPVRFCLDAPLAFLTSCDPSSLGGLQGLRLLGHLQRGIALMPNDAQGLANLLLERFETYGGSVHTGVWPESLRLRWASSPRVEMGGAQGDIGCDMILFNRAARHLPPLLPDGRKRRKLEALLNRVRVTAYAATLEVDAPAEAVPEPMARLVLLPGEQGANGGAASGPVLVAWAGDAARRRITATTRVPAPVYDAAPERVRRSLVATLRRRLRWLLPFLELESGPDDSLGLRPLYGMERGGLASLALLPHRTPYRRILLCGHQVLPGLGLEGIFLSGSCTSQLVGRRVRRRNLLPR